ncbi:MULTISPECIES: hypothetical protein [Aphanothece]|uniref:hypothetical protein n=1 Tax=Aphanothece TaxID=1121 RepID=UPI00398558C6
MPPERALPAPATRQRRRPRRRELWCPAHPDERLLGNGRKYFLHLLTAEELRQRGLTEKKARLVLQAYPVLVLSNEWLEELFCAGCGQSRWCHVVQPEQGHHRVRWAPPELWQQVAHVDPAVANPSVSEFSRREARRQRHRRQDGGRYVDLGS